MQQRKIKSFDGYEIYVTIWDEVIAPKAVVQFCHGMAEYGGRYDDFARYLNSRGYIVFADDHRGHGNTETEKNRGRHKGNIFKKTLQDELFFREWLKEEYKLPVFFAGHSYGSFIGQAFAQAGTDVKAVALLGTGHIGALAKFAAVLLAPIVALFWNVRPKIVNFASNHFFRYKGDSGKAQWVNSDMVERQKFIDDPMTAIDMSLGFDYTMLYETSKLYSVSSMAKLNPVACIALFCGSDDPVGGFGKNVDKLEKMYKDSGIKCEKNIYEGSRHEVLFDRERERVKKEIADYFDKFIIYSQTSFEDYDC